MRCTNRLSRPKPESTTSRGFTLVELMVVILLTGILGLVVVPSAASLMGGDLVDANRQISLVVRSVYNESAVRNTPMRIAWSIDTGNYWVEQAGSKVRLFGSEGEVESYLEELEERQEEQEDDLEKAERRADDVKREFDRTLAEMGIDPLLAPLMGLGAPSPQQLAAARPEPINQFQRIGDGPLGPRQLPRGIRFGSIWTPAWEDPVRSDPLAETEPSGDGDEGEEGERSRVLYTHIFPTGYAEDTVLWLEDGRDDGTALVVEPLTGRVRIESGDLRLSDLERRYR